MSSSSLYTDVSLAHHRFRTAVQHQLDVAFEDHTKVHALGPVHDVHLIVGVTCRRKIDDPTVDTGRINETNLFACNIRPGTLDIRGWEVGGFEEVSESRNYAGGRSPSGVKRVGGRQSLVGFNDGLAIRVVA